MHPSAMRLGKAFFDTYGKNRDAATVIDIGSQNVNGSLKSVAPPHFKFVGLDFATGNGVDIVLDDPYKFPLPDAYADFIVSSSCLEHSQMFWLTFLEAMRVLKNDGLLYMNVPSNGWYHAYPYDHWRFYPDAGLALESWGRRSGHEVFLVESFVNDKEQDIWNDFVAVFTKSEAMLSRYPERMVSAAKNPKNIRIHGTPGIINEESDRTTSTKKQGLIRRAARRALQMLDQ